MIILTSCEDVIDAVNLARYWTGFFEEGTDRFCVFEDVAAAFKKIDDEEFRAEQKRKGWMTNCIRFFANAVSLYERKWRA